MAEKQALNPVTDSVAKETVSSKVGLVMTFAVMGLVCAAVQAILAYGSGWKMPDIIATAIASFVGLTLVGFFAGPEGKLKIAEKERVKFWVSAAIVMTALLLLCVFQWGHLFVKAAERFSAG
jgi:Ni/Fe-hydrogenase subunit HybB-like protein